MNTVPFINYLPQLLSGTLTTIALMIFSLLIGLFLAILLTVASASRKKIFQYPINAYVFFIRGTPLLVQFFLIYFGSSQFEWLRQSIFWYLFQKPFVCAVIALAINTSAYTTVLFRGAINSIPHGEIEASKALGMSWLVMMRRIVLPRALRIVLPAYSNEVVMVLKGTSLASTITLLDLMGVTQRIIAENYAAIEFLVLAGIIYLLLNTLIITIFRYLEHKFNPHRLAT